MYFCNILNTKFTCISSLILLFQALCTSCFVLSFMVLLSNVLTITKTVIVVCLYAVSCTFMFICLFDIIAGCASWPSFWITWIMVALVASILFFWSVGLTLVRKEIPKRMILISLFSMTGVVFLLELFYWCW